MKKRFNDLIVYCAKNGYSDLHICGGQPIIYRKDGDLKFGQSHIWPFQDVESLIKIILNRRQMTMLRQRLSVDFANTVEDIRIRINIFNTDRGPSLAIRLLPGVVPSIDQLNLHPSLQTISDLKSGLVLICGATGCGKTTTIASILGDINRKRQAHLITLEDPIEYRIKSNKSFVEQREIGTHVPSVEQGLVDILRADPDVIMVGELREPQTIGLTLNAAESGHLVVGTMHAANMEDAIYRIINFAPPDAEEFIRYQLASTLAWVIVQQLVYIERVGFRVPLLSIMRGSQQIKGIIREKKLYQLDNAMHTGKADGMFTADRYMKEYLNSRDQFYNPTINFKPSTEILPEMTFQSSLFDHDIIGQSTEKPSVAENLRTDMKDKFAASPGVLLEGQSIDSNDPDGNQYVIDDSINLEDVIAQAETSLSDKKKK